MDPNLEDVQIMTDPQKLKLVLYNLVSNSIKFVNCGVIKIKTKLLNYKHTLNKIDKY